MKLKERYRRLSLWNKVAFWGSIASIIAIPIGVVLSWMSPVDEIKNDTARIVQLLEEEFRRQLGVKDSQIAFLHQQLEAFQRSEKPSLRARELAAKIPPTADPYALALKAIAERRFDDARKNLTTAQKIKEVELSRIYEARGQTEFLQGSILRLSTGFRKH